MFQHIIKIYNSALATHHGFISFCEYQRHTLYRRCATDRLLLRVACWHSVRCKRLLGGWREYYIIPTLDAFLPARQAGGHNNESYNGAHGGLATSFTWFACYVF